MPHHDMIRQKMMQKDKDDEEKIQKSIYEKYRGTKGGIFANITRKRMLGSKLSKRYRTEHIFWSEISKYIKPALLDLELFINEADYIYVNEVLNRETLKPFIDSLLSIKKVKPDKFRVEIAQLFIMAGYEYLLHWSTTPEPLKKNIEDAEEISNLLVKSLGGESRFVSSSTLEKLRI